MKITHFAIIQNPEFYCGAEFACDPPICVRAAPKVEKLFLNKGLEKCRRIAESLGFEFDCSEVTDEEQSLFDHSKKQNCDGPFVESSADTPVVVRRRH